MTHRLVHFQNAESQETPLILLGELRSIDPATELVYFGGGDWRLGVVRRINLDEFQAKASRIRAEIEKLSVRQQRRNVKTVWMADLTAQGFVQIVQYWGNDPTGEVTVDRGVPTSEYQTSIVEDWRWRTAEYLRDGGEANFAARLRHSDGTVRREEKDRLTQEWLHTDGRDKYNRVVRDRKMFGSAGMTGGVEGSLKDLLAAHTPQRIVQPGEQSFDEVLAMVAEFEYEGE